MRHEQQRLCCVFLDKGAQFGKFALSFGQRHLGGQRVRGHQNLVDPVDPDHLEEPAPDFHAVDHRVLRHAHQHLGAAHALHIRDHGGVCNGLDPATKPVIVGRHLKPFVANPIAGLFLHELAVEVVKLLQLHLHRPVQALLDGDVIFRPLFDPVSRLFLQFLLAAAQDYQDRATASLLSKSVDMDEMAEIRGRIFALRELSEVTLDDVRKVYGLGDYVAPEEKRVA